MAYFTPTQGRYLAFIHTYIGLHGYPPAESEIAAAMCVSPPSVNQMVKMLEKKGLIRRRPGQARSITILIPEDQIPPWGNRKPKKNVSGEQFVPPRAAIPSMPPAKLNVVAVSLSGGPLREKFANRVTSALSQLK